MTGTAVEFDPLSADYFDDPTEVYRQASTTRRRCTSRRDIVFYALSRFDDVVTAHRDWRGFSSTHGLDLYTLTSDPEMLRNFRMIILMDPPEHERLRALVEQGLHPRGPSRRWSRWSPR